MNVSAGGARKIRLSLEWHSKGAGILLRNRILESRTRQSRQSVPKEIYDSWTVVTVNRMWLNMVLSLGSPDFGADFLIRDGE
jgi:hypothetical protein